MVAQDTKKSGYLLIELMVALATISVCSVMAAYMQAHIAMAHKQAEQYLEAVNLACAQFVNTNLNVHDDSYTIETTQNKPDKNLAYTQITVTVSWNTPGGAQKQIVIQGGKVDEVVTT